MQWTGFIARRTRHGDTNNAFVLHGHGRPVIAEQRVRERCCPLLLLGGDEVRVVEDAVGREPAVGLSPRFDMNSSHGGNIGLTRQANVDTVEH